MVGGTVENLEAKYHTLLMSAINRQIRYFSNIVAHQQQAHRHIAFNWKTDEIKSDGREGGVVGRVSSPSIVSMKFKVGNVCTISYHMINLYEKAQCTTLLYLLMFSNSYAIEFFILIERPFGILILGIAKPLLLGK